jgi:hypothetical protein
MFGIARTEWLGFHVWSSIAIGLLTLAHVVLNRRGLTRSYRVVAGAPTRPVAAAQSMIPSRRGSTSVAALALVIVVIGGSWVFASSGDTVGGGGGRTEAGQELDEASSIDEEPTRVRGSGNGYRGGRGDREG